MPLQVFELMKSRNVLMEKMSLHTIDGQGIQEVTGGRTDQRKRRVLFEDVVLQFLKPASRERKPTETMCPLQVVKEHKRARGWHRHAQTKWIVKVRNKGVLLHGIIVHGMFRLAFLTL